MTPPAARAVRSPKPDPEVAAQGKGGVVGTGDLGEGVPDEATAASNRYEPNPDAPEGSKAQVQIVDA